MMTQDYRHCRNCQVTCYTAWPWCHDCLRAAWKALTIWNTLMTVAFVVAWVWFR